MSKKRGFVRYVKPVNRYEAKRAEVKPPKIDPKVKTEDSVKALLAMKGGEEIVKKLMEKGIKLPGVKR